MSLRIDVTYAKPQLRDGEPAKSHRTCPRYEKNKSEYDEE